MSGRIAAVLLAFAAHAASCASSTETVAPEPPAMKPTLPSADEPTPDIPGSAPAPIEPRPERSAPSPSPAAPKAEAPPPASAKPAVGLPVGSDAPPFQLKLMNPDRARRASMSLADHVGKAAPDRKKGVLLSFAASYCGPCKKELVDLARAEPKWREAGLVTAVVVIDTEAAGIEAMRAFLLDELELGFPVLADRFAILARRYRADALPYVVLVDAEGKVRWSHAGYDPAGLDAVLAKLP